MKTVEELKQMKYDITRKMGDYLECLTEWTSYIEEREREDSDLYRDLYQKGLEDAWKLAGKVTLPPSQEGMTAEEILECFDVVNEWYVLRSPVSVAQEMYDTWKAKKEQEEQIHVGDVVVSLTTGNEYIVLYKIDDGEFSAIMVSGGDTIIFRKEYVKKTGKHYDLPWLTEEEQEKQDDSD
jgi:hypothetical protein